MNEKAEFSVKEPLTDWGGPWTEKKLDAFAKYVQAYLIIMEKRPYWETIYFDGFAGSGNRGSNNNSPLINELEMTENEENLYKGAAERVLTLKKGHSFDYHYFIDTNREALDNLKSRIHQYQATKNNPFNYLRGDCNEHLKNLAETMMSSRDYAALVLLDPFGMQIDWDAVASLKETRTDIWILVPTGVIVNRLLDKKGKLNHSTKLQSFFGITEDEIREYFYIEDEQQTWLDEEPIKKVSKPIEKIARLYIARLKTQWIYVTEEPLILYNSKGVPIFHFVFASNNKTALKIASDIIGKG